jgi:hypothetical protein
MKKLIPLMFLFCFNSSFCQLTISTPNNDYKVIKNKRIVEDKLYIDSFYDNKDLRLITNGIVYFDSVGKKEIMNKAKNWASTAFVNLREVLVGETEDQIVINFISNSFFTKSFTGNYPSPRYIKLVLKFKDNKLKYEYYDDGNTSQGGVTPRIIFLVDWFKEKKGKVFARDSAIEGLLALKEQIDNNVQSLILSVNSHKKEDW